MITFEKVLVLKNIPFFANASELALSDLISVCEEHTVKAGEIILTPEKENKFLFMILSGNVRIFDEDELLAELGARQVFGETTVMSPATIPYRIEAQTDTTFLRIEGDQLLRMMALHPTLAKGFVGELSKRLQQIQIKNTEK